ncbi:DALR anticodon-binding domain-containing protein [Argonema galeatum]|uniref:DALR anticodon-binding domain-containing protein n=1 Tax=Argonema galeatum TaxID=2942762 RepID=UPI00201295E1|nr:DALR anticodon-binding domain-containing protein [Argonema galeatum]MCL1464384.1 hypothetical protein [Argonema galeatum A003/A1]
MESQESDDKGRQSSVNEGSPVAEYPAIKHLLLVWLQEAIDSIGQSLGIPAPHIPSDAVVENGVKAGTLALYQVKDETKILYVSSIALKLSKLWGIPILDLATAISEELSHSNVVQNTDSERYCMVEVIAPGLIHLQLSDLGISAWLQRLVGHGKSKVKSQKSKEKGDKEEIIAHSRLSHPKSHIFAVQYAHARCCSLLRLAHREGAIALVEPDRDTSPAHWGLVSPNPIPWLTSDKKLRLVHPAERALICHLFALQDNLYCLYPLGREINWEKTALALSDLFETFYSRCRIWGEVKREDLCLAQARLGLLVVTQTLLRLVLQDFLGVSAPLEL